MIKLIVVAVLLLRSLYFKLLFKTLTGTAVYNCARTPPKHQNQKVSLLSLIKDIWMKKIKGAVAHKDTAQISPSKKPS